MLRRAVEVNAAIFKGALARPGSLEVILIPISCPSAHDLARALERLVHVTTADVVRLCEHRAGLASALDVKDAGGTS